MNNESCKGCRYSKVYYHGFENGKANFSMVCYWNGKHLTEEEYKTGCEKNSKNTVTNGD